MNIETKQLLEKYLQEYYNEDYTENSLTDKNILVDFFEDQHRVKEYFLHSCRWYDSIKRIIELDKDVYIEYNWYHITGDNTVSDMGLELD